MHVFDVLGELIVQLDWLNGYLLFLKGALCDCLVILILNLLFSHDPRNIANHSCHITSPSFLGYLIQPTLPEHTTMTPLSLTSESDGQNHHLGQCIWDSRCLTKNTMNPAHLYTAKLSLGVAKQSIHSIQSLAYEPCSMLPVLP